MEEKKEAPTGITSFYVIPNLQTDHFCLNKKRKLPAEQLGLPMPKHKHCNGSSSSEYVFPYVKSFDEGSEPESENDSNSFNEESDSAMSAFGEPKFESDHTMTCTYDSSSSRSTAMDSSSTGQGQEVTFASCETVPRHHDDGLHTIREVQDHLLELGNHEAYSCAEYRTDSIEECTDQELEDLLYSNGLNPNTYVLSSGRWSVNQETQSVTRIPTIDQEFEQYFSMLML